MNHPRPHQKRISAIALSLGLVLFSFLSAQAAPAPHWTDLARHVAQNEKARPQALALLKKTPNLDKILLDALETRERSHALDVIAALERKDMIPALLDRLSSDRDGFVALTLNSMLDASTRSQILDAYVENLKPERLVLFSFATQIAMLEPLGRAGIALPKDTLLALFDQDVPEIRSATLHYVRHRILRFGEGDKLSDMVVKAVSASPYQLRIQALFLVDEMLKAEPTRKTPNIDEVFAICQKDKNDSVRNWCVSTKTAVTKRKAAQK